MTPLRQRLREALPRRGLSERPQAMSVRAVRPLADHYHTSPDRITEEDCGPMSSIVSMTSTLHALPVPSRCVGLRAATSIPSSAHGRR
jgi:hypothetical protein